MNWEREWLNMRRKLTDQRFFLARPICEWL